MKKRLEDMIIAGFKDAIAYEMGDKSRGVATTFRIPVLDVKAIRKKSGMTQEEFSRAFAIKTRTLQEWEQQRRMPNSQTRTLLALIDRHPKEVAKTLRALGKIDNTVPARKKKRRNVRLPSGSVRKAKKADGPRMHKTKNIA
jgi:putative transcriptional regulator